MIASQPPASIPQYPQRSTPRRQLRPSASLRKALLSRHCPSLPPLYEAPQAPMKEMEISIIVTTWDDDGKCWYPVEVMGPIEKELRKHAERKRRERQLEMELTRERT
ncbi:hypothetical protein BP6252_04628 [Coleophoma cylindrospora]|uniref:Uncharacterized protein n=1 Tax=Coleophoma cylindrospora TaxID=1849047 RepID=A0A3D8S1H0_9HELO|nr:hypothetical protein BP6252_04628 [Coleophoma cylindrospora]